MLKVLLKKYVFNEKISLINNLSIFFTYFDINFELLTLLFQKSKKSFSLINHLFFKIKLTNILVFTFLEMFI